VVRRDSGKVLGLLAVAASWGLFWGGWAALIPAIKAKLALTDQELGLALFAVPVAAVPAMLFTGRVTDRLAQHTLPIVTGIFALGVVFTGLAPSRPAFTLALLVVGGASGAIEVALNATTAAHEARDGARLFNKVHAVTPLAMVVAAPGVGLATELGVSPPAVLTVIALLTAASAVLAVDPRGWSAQAGTDDEPGSRRGLHYGPLLLIGAVGAVVLLMENAVEQWGAIHLDREAAAGPLLASLAPAGYMIGLSVGRMLAQWKGDRCGDRVLVAAGGSLGGIGLAAGAAGGSAVAVIVGFTLAGVGLAPVLPTLLGMAGRASGARRRSTAISLVTTASYAGFLLSPPLVGLVAGLVGLPMAFGLLALGGVVVLAGAQVVRLLPVREDRPMQAVS
jgi:MFS family permease